MSEAIREQRSAQGAKHFTAQLIFLTSFFNSNLSFFQGMSLKCVIPPTGRSSFREGHLNQSNNLLIRLSDTKILNTHSDWGELPFLAISVKSVQLISRGQVIHPLGKLLCSLMTFQHQTALLSPACSCSCEGVSENEEVQRLRSLSAFFCSNTNQKTVHLAHRFRFQWHTHWGALTAW